VEDADRERIRQRLLRDIPTLLKGMPGETVEMTLALLRRARRHPEALAEPDDPFAWKPIFVRRSLGLASIDACAAGRFPTPSQAVGPIADRAVAEWRRSGWRSFHWEPWLASLAPGAHLAVLAEAATWATTLWSSLDWHQFSQSPMLGHPDDQWTCSAAPAVRLRGRSELRVPLPPPGRRTPGGAAPQVALVSVASGVPADDWIPELAYLALVAGLRAPARPVPARVVGLWPDAGLYRAVDIDHPALDGAANLVVSVISTLAQALPDRQNRPDFQDRVGRQDRAIKGGV
jgi:hypothetical protein